jgi:hypothetical protein
METSRLDQSVPHLREDMIENGILFWKHERVKDTPFNERISFLRQKGLTQEEIEEVQRQVAVSNAMDNRYALPLSRQQRDTSSRRQSLPGQVANQNFPASSYPVPQIQYVTGLTHRAGIFEKIYSFLAQILAYGGVVGAGVYVLRQYFGDSAFYSFPAGAESSRTTRQKQSSELSDVKGTLLKGGDKISNKSTDYPYGEISSPIRLSPQISKETTDIECIRQDLAVTSSKLEMQSQQLREAIKALNEIARNQTSHFANNTSLGLLLANSVANQSTQERSTQNELKEIKQLLTNCTVVNGQQLNGDTKPGTKPTSSKCALDSSLENLVTKKGNAKIVEVAQVVKSEHVAGDAQKPPQIGENAIDTKISNMKAEINQIFSKILTENTPETQDAAHGMLSMILKNLMEHPDIPRYKRVKSDNPNFKKMLAPLKHHEDFLLSLGFSTRGNYFEYNTIPRSHEASEQDIEDAQSLSNTTLQHAIELLKKLKIGQMLPSVPSETRSTAPFFSASQANRQLAEDEARDPDRKNNFDSLITTGGSVDAGSSLQHMNVLNSLPGVSEDLVKT